MNHIYGKNYDGIKKFSKEELKIICNHIQKQGIKYICGNGSNCLDRNGDCCGRIARQLREIDNGYTDFMFFISKRKPINF